MKSIFFSTGGVHIATMLGMLSELQNRIDEPNAVGGLSAGALLAAMCATHGVSNAVEVMTVHSTDNLLKNKHKYFNTIISVLFSDSLVDSTNLKNTVKELLKNKTLKCDLYVAYTDRDSMQYVSKKFEKGKQYPNLYKHVVASMSIPCFLQAQKIEDKEYVDAGLFHTLPVEAMQKVIQQSINQKDPLDLVLLSAKPWGYHLTSKVKHSKWFPMLKDAYHILSGFECIGIHNDQLLLNEILKNAKLQHDHVNYSFFSIGQHDTEEWCKKIPFEKYGNIERKDVEKLMELGKNIIIKCTHSDLKF